MYKKIVLHGWQAVNANYVKDGVATGVSGSTDPNPVEVYKKIEVGTSAQEAKWIGCAEQLRFETASLPAFRNAAVAS